MRTIFIMEKHCLHIADQKKCLAMMHFCKTTIIFSDLCENFFRISFAKFFEQFRGFAFVNTCRTSWKLLQSGKNRYCLIPYRKLSQNSSKRNFFFVFLIPKITKFEVKVLSPEGIYFFEIFFVYSRILCYSQ
jgi:hypothetical protein